MLPVSELLFLMVLGISLGDEDKDCIQERISLINPSYVEQKLDRFQSELQELKSKLENRVLFTRWGRRDCPQGISTLVYAGYTGGSRHTHNGSAAEYVCLPPDPTWGPFKYLEHSSVGYMYGAEYEAPEQMFGVSNTKEDIPCAVCEGTSHSVVLMIPGRVNCYPNWVEAYHGNLVSGYRDHQAASQYICMDGEPQTVPGGGAVNDNGKLVYGVKTVCGSLPCPPYENDKFLSCVVCLK
ncbi:uncharacterized protein LOC117326054 [Pecten maximus]|uniref:uncharacterized protein LOC117326054 n=1 Tax=Pecten maximus TaxID=6579 RepID=UPI0014589370|nr:uncharacterized protein LOC117326054 [Pecten maximus]